MKFSTFFILIIVIVVTPIMAQKPKKQPPKKKLPAISKPIEKSNQPSAPLITKTIIYEGDSRTDFDGFTNNNPAKMLAALFSANYIHRNDFSKNTSSLKNTIQVVNIAQSGETLLAMMRQSVQGDALLTGSETSKIFIIDGGGNDLATGREVSETFADLQTIVKVQTAKGYKVLIGTVCQANVTKTFQTAVADLNTLIRNNYPKSQILDFATVPKLNGYTNTTYFQSDGIHYTNAAKQIKAKFIYDKLTAKEIAE